MYRYVYHPVYILFFLRWIYIYHIIISYCMYIHICACIHISICVFLSLCIMRSLFSIYPSTFLSYSQWFHLRTRKIGHYLKNLWIFELPRWCAKKTNTNMYYVCIYIYMLCIMYIYIYHQMSTEIVGDDLLTRKSCHKMYT